MKLKLALALAPVMCLVVSPALAQTATGTGVGVANSESNSAAGAIAVNRGNGGNSNSSLTINNPAQSRVESVVSGTTTSNINQTVSGGTRNTNEVTGTSTIKNVPGTLAPGLAAAGIETCLGSVSGGGSIVGFGASFGTTVPDPDCTARLTARQLYAMGLKAASVAVLCARENIYRAMPDICNKYMPRVAAQNVGYVEPAPFWVPRPVVAPDYGYPPGRYAGGSIELIDGKTGLNRMCDDYNEAGQKCRRWAAAPHQPLKPTKLAAKPSRIIVMSKKPAKPIETTETKPSTPTAAIAAAVSDPK